jgi:hypothetical protein
MMHMPFDNSSGLYWQVLLYLMPAALIAYGLSRLSRHLGLFAFLTLTGTLLHELSHFSVGTLLGARPVALNLFPKARRDGSYVMGSVTFSNLRWFNAAPTALAPLLIMPLVISVAWWRVHTGWRPGWIDLALWPGLAPQLLACWPSSTDWRLSVRSWPLGCVGGLGWYFWHPLWYSKWNFSQLMLGTGAKFSMLCC